MAWTPKKTVGDFTTVVDNLLAFIAANQVDAMAWAGATSVFEKFYPNAAGRLGSIFPNLMVVRQTQANDITSDELLAGVELLIEGSVTGPEPDALVLNAKQMAMAVESMINNLPQGELLAGGQNTGCTVLLELETEFDVLRGQQTATSFLQIWQTRAVFRIHSVGYNV